MGKINKMISVDGEEWDFVAKEVSRGASDRRGKMSEFINDFVVREAKKRGMMGGYVNVFSPSTAAPEQKEQPETPEQTWKRIEGEVNYVRSCIEAGKEDNPDYTNADFPFMFEYAKKCMMGRAEFEKWVNGDYKEIEIKANVLGK